MILKYLILSLFISVATSSCNKNNSNSTNTTTEPFFAKGADISWLSEMVSNGKKFYDSTGQEKDLINLLKLYGINTVRLRVWVNPANFWNSNADVLAKALKAKAEGMHIMLDFHYSNSWADPGQQTTPSNWQGLDISVLKDSLRNYTTACLAYLKSGGVEPEWVQIGNETNDGLLWPVGKASSSMANFSELIKTGANAVKNILPNAKVIVHISNGWDNNLFRWIFDGLKANNADWDVIGLSLYPSTSNWAALNNQCLSNMNDMVSRYNKEVMIVEVGMSWDEPSICKEFITDIIAKTKSVANKKGIGVLYWEPEAYNWYSYTLGCFDLTGKPTVAMSAFK
jgi:arabinogalactan endo-1,4-beta-galactosidase